MYFTAVLFVHSALCITLIGLVLLQQGKGADAGATFGGGSNSLFGAAGATDFITKLTTSLAVGFMITSILLIRAYTTTGGQGIVINSNTPRDIAEGSIMAPAEPPAAKENNSVEFIDVDPTKKGDGEKKEGSDVTEKAVTSKEEAKVGEAGAAAPQVVTGSDAGKKGAAEEEVAKEQAPKK